MKRPLAPLLLCFLVILPCWSAPAEDNAPEPSRADLGQLQQVVRDHRIETAAAQPGAALYLRDVTVAVVDGITAIVERILPGLSGLTGTIVRVGALGIIAVAVLLLLLFLLRMALRRERPEKASSGIRVLPQPEHAGARSQERWAAALDRYLDQHDVAAALEALWWWFAYGLLPRDVDPSWTTRELISHAGRWDLTAWVGRLDRMIYGAESPAVDEVRRFWGDLREVLE